MDEEFADAREARTLRAAAGPRTVRLFAAFYALGDAGATVPLSLRCWLTSSSTVVAFECPFLSDRCSEVLQPSF